MEELSPECVCPRPASRKLMAWRGWLSSLSFSLPICTVETAVEPGAGVLLISRDSVCKVTVMVPDPGWVPELA